MTKRHIAMIGHVDHGKTSLTGIIAHLMGGADVPVSTSPSTLPKASDMAEPEQPQDVAGAGDPPQRPPLELALAAQGILDALALDYGAKPSQQARREEAIDRAATRLRDALGATVPVAGNQPVAYTGSGSLALVATGGEGFIWGEPADAHPVPLYADPRYVPTGGTTAPPQDPAP